MLGWFQALMPKEGRFFQLFEKHATIVVAGAEALRGLLQGGENIEGHCKQIFELEAQADDITREFLSRSAERLSRRSIAPTSRA
jgi:uncharacterized protein Yka (UPF0111/DUF47 family)